MPENPLRDLPKMDLLLAALERAGREHSRALLRQAAREVLEELRASLKSGALEAAPPLASVAALAEDRAGVLARPSLRRVVNATGVVLHTNLGRAPLAPAAASAVAAAAAGYSGLEYDLSAGVRGSRQSHVESLLCRLTGAEAALAVNNNAAAVLLMLSALAGGRTVAVSRGELVEIGGGFRVPDIMARSGALLCEVGTTNRTRLSDYESAVTDREAEALLKVHTSNYRIVGFTEDTPLPALAALGRRYGLPILYDLGSGALAPEFYPTLPDCPTVRGGLSDGADVVCFSADKLLGGPQAGVVVGKRAYVEAMKRHPLARAARIDKLSLAALEATLRLCLDPAEALGAIPVLAMLSADPESLRARAEALAGRLAPLAGAGVNLSVVPAEGEVGGGAQPGRPLPGWAVALIPRVGGAESLAAALRGADAPVVGRIRQGMVLLDVRTMLPGEEEAVVSAAASLGLPNS